MRNALSAGLLLCALACNTDQPAGITSVADTPKEGVLHAPAVGAKPGDQAIVTVSGASLSALAGAWFVPPGAGDKDSIPARFTIGKTGDTAFVSVVVPSSGNMWDLVLAFPHAERRLVTPLRASGGPTTTPVDTGPPQPPPPPLVPESITLDPSPAVRIPSGRGRSIALSGHGLQGVTLVTVRKAAAAGSPSRMRPYFSASENSLAFTFVVDSTAMPGTAYDLELSGTTTAGSVDIFVPAFLVVDDPPQVLDFAGDSSIRQTVVIARNGLLCPGEDDPGVQPCADYLVRLPGAGHLDTKLNWRNDPMGDVTPHIELQVDHPGQAKASDSPPLEFVSSGDTGDLIRITVIGVLYYGGATLTLTFTPQP